MYSSESTSSDESEPTSKRKKHKKKKSEKSHKKCKKKKHKTDKTKKEEKTYGNTSETKVKHRHKSKKRKRDCRSEEEWVEVTDKNNYKLKDVESENTLDSAKDKHGIDSSENQEDTKEKDTAIKNAPCAVLAAIREIRYGHDTWHKITRSSDRGQEDKGGGGS